MTAQPRLSIGLPVYNGEEYLAESLDALLGQTYEDFELVISDNASTDGTQELCRKYAARDSRIRYLRLPRNIGATPA
jgi:glycosyltransferase involved in cell wall biosynthesis